MLLTGAGLTFNHPGVIGGIPEFGFQSGAGVIVTPYTNPGFNSFASFTHTVAYFSGLKHLKLTIVGGGGGGSASGLNTISPPYSSIKRGGAGGASGCVIIAFLEPADGITGSFSVGVGRGGAGGTVVSPTSVVGGGGTFSDVTFPPATPAVYRRLIARAGAGNFNVWTGQAGQQGSIGASLLPFTNPSLIDNTKLLTVQGSPGQSGSVGFPYTSGGFGGSCLFGIGGAGHRATADLGSPQNGAGSPGSGFGGGGGGGAQYGPIPVPSAPILQDGQGAPGNSGIVIVEEFY
jgi:hypothetical protein